jgi:hypothetical protein
MLPKKDPDSENLLTKWNSPSSFELESPKPLALELDLEENALLQDNKESEGGNVRGWRVSLSVNHHVGYALIDMIVGSICDRPGVCHVLLLHRQKRNDYYYPSQSSHPLMMPHSKIYVLSRLWSVNLGKDRSYRGYSWGRSDQHS